MKNENENTTPATVAAVLRRAVDEWGADVDADNEINGGDAVDWLSRFIPDARAALANVDQADAAPVESVPANVAALVESEGADLAWGQVDAVQLCEWIMYAAATDAALANAWHVIEYRFRLAWAARQAAGGEYSPGGAA